jgi:hypothetical protein
LSLRQGLTHSLGLAIFLASLVLASAPLLGAPWEKRTVLLLVWGAMGYLAIAAIEALRTPWVKPALVPPSQSAATPVGVDDFARLTEEALKYLRTPAELQRCGLADRLPHVLAQARAASATPDNVPTPLEKARLLRGIIEESMEALRLASGDEPGALQYAILHSEYVLGLPNSAIMTRHSISEGTFHRRRRDGVRALAGELYARESRALELASK